MFPNFQKGFSSKRKEVGADTFDHLSGPAFLINWQNFAKKWNKNQTFENEVILEGFNQCVFFIKFLM